MPLNIVQVRECLRSYNFDSLFVNELGWEQYKIPHEVSVDDQTYILSPVAEKRGLAVFACSVSGDSPFPDYATRRKIERHVAKFFREHLIIYINKARGIQTWQWVKREPGRPAACREHTYHHEQSGEALIQKLRSLVFTLEEEEDLSIVDVASRTRAAFDVEHITKRFYDRFKTEHGAFLKFLKGIPDEELQRWYASVMLNRLMFIYFIQKKSFLDNDIDYLRNKLNQSKERGADRYYKGFLCTLFFKGFAEKESERSEATNLLLGRVPYLNGGLFLLHQIEELHGKEIQIADEAFERLFDFFEQYHWHLDERPLRADNEINPDVLGYIFEKYINQKQMGAYYTKEDITEYISKNTIIPYLFDAAAKKCKIAFEGDRSVWRLLQQDPDRYIYDAVKKGTDSPLPSEIAEGITDVSRRTEWNKPAPVKYALPTEIWRETVARRQRYEEVRGKLVDGKIRSINDFITYNLNIRQFAQDVIENCEGPELLRAFYRSIERVTVMDPTCGSGAFLFAALNVLETLYEACLDRMQVFLEELETSGEKKRPEKFSDFRKILDHAARHPNRRYFILKSIILNNLFGVDIMEEAIEICKLRLFLKLVAQVERVNEIEPLPDIDFNVKAGNTLVGFVDYEQVKRAVTSDPSDLANISQIKMFTDEPMRRIEEKAVDVDRLFALFRQQQTEIGGEVTAEDKQELLSRLKGLEDELNRYLAGEYRVDPEKKGEYDKWLATHKPFHWFIEFYGIMKKGGFDVIIGNPPYVEYSKVKREYNIQGYATEKCGNLYAFVMERSTELLHHSRGNYGMIVPISLPSTPRMSSARDLLEENSNIIWCSNFADRPGTLFTGVHQKLSIIISKKHIDEKQHSFFTSAYRHWYGQKKNNERRGLMESITYAPTIKSSMGWVKSGNLYDQSIYHKLCLQDKCIAEYFQGLSKFSLNMRMMYWGKSFTAEHKSSEYKHFPAPSTLDKKVIVAVFNSSLYFWFWELASDCWHITTKEINNFFIDLENMIHKSQIADLTDMLMKDLNDKKRFVGTKQTEYEYYHKFSKPILDEIDRVLAKHYGFTDEELDFIINYDIKYRMRIK